MRDFTIDCYSRLLDSLIDRGLETFAVVDWIKRRQAEGVLLRHDVDRKPLNALKVAELEAGKGIRGTYYFRVVGSAWSPAVIRAVSSFGHEVGYHYEDLAMAKGRREVAVALFESNLEKLRDLVKVETISMHGSPLSRFNNLDIWKHADFKEYGIIGDAILSVDYSEMAYLTDTGRSWDDDSSNLRDRPDRSRAFTVSRPHDTVGLMAWITESEVDRIALSVHPERWSSSKTDYCIQYLWDTIANLAKTPISRLRGYRR